MCELCGKPYQTTHWFQFYCQECERQAEVNKVVAKATEDSELYQKVKMAKTFWSQPPEVQNYIRSMI